PVAVVVGLESGREVVLILHVCPAGDGDPFEGTDTPRHPGELPEGAALPLDLDALLLVTRLGEAHPAVAANALMIPLQRGEDIVARAPVDVHTAVSIVLDAAVRARDDRRGASRASSSLDGEVTRRVGVHAEEPPHD